MYRSDHIKVLKVLAEALPKRQTFKTKDIVVRTFKRAVAGDRRVRNAYRKLRKEGYIEIVDRGVYRLTASGAAFCRRLQKDNWSVPKTAKKATKRVTGRAGRLAIAALADKRRRLKKLRARRLKAKRPLTEADKEALADETLEF